MIWHLSKDGDLKALELFRRHYSCINKNPKISQFVGPGQKMVLVHINSNWDYDALFVWRHAKYTSDAQWGVNCAVFRNESELLSSKMILEAEDVVQQRWFCSRFYTFVNPGKIKSTNPGCCFIKAGWKKCGKTKARKLQILEKLLEPRE